MKNALVILLKILEFPYLRPCLSHGEMHKRLIKPSANAAARKFAIIVLEETGTLQSACV